MKYHKLAIALLFIALFCSCEPPVVFSEPQPKGVDALTSIPEDFQGTYWCDKDSVGLYVNKTLIYKSKLFDVALSHQEIEDTEDLKLEDGQLFLKNSKESFSTIEKNGIIYSTINLKDTLFSNQMRQHVLKQFKGRLILNNKISNTHWEVKIISLKPEGLLSLSKVDYPENLTELENITTIKKIDSSDRMQILVSPTKIEFDKILNKKLIFAGNCQEFEPISSLKQ